jgi:hypothetical protein
MQMSSILTAGSLLTGFDPVIWQSSPHCLQEHLAKGGNAGARGAGSADDAPPEDAAEDAIRERGRYRYC